MTFKMNVVFSKETPEFQLFPYPPSNQESNPGDTWTPFLPRTIQAQDWGGWWALLWQNRRKEPASLSSQLCMGREGGKLMISLKLLSQLPRVSFPVSMQGSVLLALTTSS
jgi:hypothetical protein